MHVPTWEGDLYPLRPESPHCPGGSAPPTPPMARLGGEGPLLSDWQGGVASELPAVWVPSCKNEERLRDDSQNAQPASEAKT